MKVDAKTVQKLVRAAQRQSHAPGKYDVFAWRSGDEIHSLTVAWLSFTKRSIPIVSLVLADGEEISANAAPLPNGVNRHEARCIGSFRIDRRTDPAGA